MIIFICYLLVTSINWAHDSRSIHCVPICIVVLLLGPHQPHTLRVHCIMPNESLATNITRSSAGMTLTEKRKHIITFLEREWQQPTQFQYAGMIKDTNINLSLLVRVSDWLSLMAFLAVKLNHSLTPGWRGTSSPCVTSVTTTWSRYFIGPWWHHIASRNLVNIGSGNGLVPIWHQGITWISADLLSIGPLETNICETWIKIQWFSFKKMHPKKKLYKILAMLFGPECV